jgi:hypothetical protein
LNGFSDQVFSRLLDRPESERGGGANEDGASVASVLLDAAGPYPDSKGVHGSLQHDELMNFMFAGTSTAGSTTSCSQEAAGLPVSRTVSNTTGGCVFHLLPSALGASCLPVVPCLGGRVVCRTRRKLPPRLTFRPLAFPRAGHETTANTMSWAMYELAKRPDYQRRCADEIQQLVAKHGKPLQQFSYKEMNGLRDLTKVRAVREPSESRPRAVRESLQWFQ